MIESVENFSETEKKLLLLADPNEKLVASYIKRSHNFVCRDAAGEVVGVLVLLATHPQTLEIVNIAVAEAAQRKGYGKEMLAFAEAFAKEKHCVTLEIGTGTTSLAQLYLYQKCGFRFQYIDVDFFTQRYDEPIYENGLLLRDMVRLHKIL